MSELLRIEDLAFSYGAREIFSEISLTVGAGEIICLMGPNGCGKTTLLDNIMGLHKPRRGRILLEGRALDGYKRREIARRIAYVPQLHEVTFPYTTLEMVTMGRTAYTGLFNGPQAEDEEICRAALRQCGIEHFADLPYSRLSGGELKLALLARSLGQATNMIIMDEPTAHLDFRNELLFLETAAGLARDQRITLLMATHSPDHAFYFESQGLPVRAALLHQGRMTECGPPGAVITESSLARVYGVKASVLAARGGDGRISKTVALQHTI